MSALANSVRSTITINSPDLPITPTNARPHTTHLATPPASIQKYSNALRRAMSARFEEVAKAGQRARPPSSANMDPDYGYDEDPFDTRARLLMSFGAADAPLLPAAAAAVAASSPFPQTPEHGNEIILDSPPMPLPSPKPSRRRWSATSFGHSAPGSAASTRPTSMFSLGGGTDDYDGCDTPSSVCSHVSEASFEAGRASDYLQAYGRPTIRTTASYSPRTPPVAMERRHSLLGASSALASSALRPLTPLTPSPQPPSIRRAGASANKRRRSMNRPYGESSEWEDAMALARTTSETMLLAAGFATQRERGQRNRGVRV